MLSQLQLEFGPFYKHKCTALTLSGVELAYGDMTNYLGVMLICYRLFIRVPLVILS